MESLMLEMTLIVNAVFMFAFCASLDGYLKYLLSLLLLC